MELLGSEGVRQERSVQALLNWAEKNSIRLPTAYLEWARLDDGTLLRKYSNDDWFMIDEPEVVATPDGVRGLRFHSENQNNFDRIVTLDQGEDPPVLFAWIGRPPWVKNAERFSDAVFAQVFDWQYLLEFKPDDPEYKEMGYAGDIDLKTDGCLAILRQRYEELVSTRLIVDEDCYTEYRFMKSLKERITVTVDAARKSHIRITGEGNLVPALEAEFLDLFGDDVVPPGFNSVLWAADFIGSRIDKGWLRQLRHACREPPTVKAVDRLIACHGSKPIRDRVFNETFPRQGYQFSFGGSAWGVMVTFRRRDDGWWCLESIREIAP